MIHQHQQTFHSKILPYVETELLYLKHETEHMTDIVAMLILTIWDQINPSELEVDKIMDSE